MATSSTSPKMGKAPGTASLSAGRVVKPRTRKIPPQYLDQVYSTPTFKPGLDSSVDEYRKRLADILKKIKKIEESEPGKYDSDTLEKNIGSFTVLPTYDREGYLGGHDLEEIKEALNDRRKEIQGDPVEYSLAEKRYKNLSDQIENNEKEVARRKKEAEKQANNWGQDKLAEDSKETEGIKNVISNLREERSKYFGKMKSCVGLLNKVQAALDFESKNPSSPLIHKLKGQVIRYKTELRLIESGLNESIDNLSTALSNGPQDTTFYKNGKKIDNGEARSLLEIATTQKTREVLDKRNIGKEIRRKNERQSEIIDGMAAQIKRLRSELVEKRGAVSPETLDALFRVLRVVNGSKEFSSKEMMADVKFLKDFVSINTKQVEELEDLYGPDISQRSSAPILRSSSSPLARLPGDVPLSVEHITMLGGNPIADLIGNGVTHNWNIAVYEAWKKAWLDSGKIDTYRDKNKTNGLWKNDEEETKQIATTKELFNIELELLRLSSFTNPPRLTDNFEQGLIIYAKILAGVTKKKVKGQADEEEITKYLIENYNHDAELKKIEERKAQLAEAINNKKNKEIKKQKQEKAPTLNKDLEFLSTNDSWEQELLSIRLSAFTKRSEAERATLDIFKTEMEVELAAVARPSNYNIPYIQSLLEKIEKKITLLNSGGIMTEMATRQLYYSKLFSNLSNAEINKLDTDQREAIQKFKKDEAEIIKIIFGVVNYGTTMCNELKAKTENIKNIVTQDLNTRLAKYVKVLSAISAAKEKIDIATLATYGIVDNDAQELIETLKKAGILK